MTRKTALPFRQSNVEFQNREHQLASFKPFGLRTVDVTFTAAATSATAAHGLGREYTAAFAFMAVDSPAADDAVGLCAATPELARSLGYDPKTTVLLLRSDTTALPGESTFRVLVY